MDDRGDQLPDWWVHDEELETFLDAETGCLATPVPSQLNHIFGPDFYRSDYELTATDKPRNAVVPGVGRFHLPKFAKMTCWWCGKTYARVVAENPGVTFVLNDPHPEFENLRFYELTWPER